MLTATISLEIEIEVKGNIQPAEPDVGISQDYCDGFEIAGLHTYKRIKGGFARDKNLLDGVDVTDPNVQRLLANIEAVIKDEAEQAIMDEAIMEASSAADYRYEQWKEQCSGA